MSRKRAAGGPTLPEPPAPKADVAAIEDVEEVMRDVVDPELGIKVVDLGLVYDLHVEADNSATIDMTFTSAACPLTDMIEDQTRARFPPARAADWWTTSGSTGSGCRRGARRRSPRTAASRCAPWGSPFSAPSREVGAFIGALKMFARWLRRLEARTRVVLGGFAPTPPAGSWAVEKCAESPTRTLVGRRF